MRSYFPLCFLVATAELLLILHHIPLAAASVEDTCKAIAAGNPNIDFNFCLTSLRSDPSSGSADTKTLASIAVRLASSSASSTSSKIEALLGGGGNAKTTEALKTCKSIYGDMTSNLADAKSAIGSGDLGTAKTRLSAALDAPGDCEQGFSELGVPSPLTKENGDGQQLAAIALAITNNL